MTTPDQRTRTAATIMLLWDHPDRNTTIQTLIAEVHGTPLAPILDAYLSNKKIDPSPVRELVPVVNKVSKARIGLRNQSITGHVMEYSNSIFQKRRFAFDGMKWYCQPLRSGFFHPVTVQEVPYQCREGIFWTVVVNCLTELAEVELVQS